MSTPDRVDLDEILVRIVEVVDVAACLLHQHALDQLASADAIRLTDLGIGGQAFERLREFVDE